MPRIPSVLLLVGGLIGSASFLTGCVSQGEYDRLYEANRSLESRNSELTRERDEARASLDLLRGGSVGAESALSAAQRQNAALRAQLDQALASLRALDSRIAGMSFGPLDAETDAALRDLVAKYPNLITYDAANGMLRFAADLTFDSGSDAVKSDARQALNALAQVLSTPVASQYELWVEGHTDSQRISSRTAARHPTNRHLSAHRAIAVINELAGMGVNPAKMMAAGWGEHHPAVPNTASGNTPANRRVEIYLARARKSADSRLESVPPTTDARPMDITK